MSRALFVIGGFGLGNSTRCAAVIEKLRAQGVLVDVATSANGIWYFSDSHLVNKLFTLEPLSYQLHSGRISFLGTLLFLPKLMWNLIFNAAMVLSLQRKYQYSFIAADSEYSAFLARIFVFAPLVSINNVFFTFSDLMSELPKQQGWRVLPGRVFEYFDFLIQNYLSDVRIAPSLAKNPNKRDDRILFCPPLVRSGLPSNKRDSKLTRALVIASGSGMGVSQNTVNELSKCEGVDEIRVIGLTGESRGKVKFLGRQKDISSFLSDSDFIVSNGGFSTISEALLTSRPLLMIPIANHFEQIQNARFVESLGLGVVTSDKNIQKDFVRLSKCILEAEERSLEGNGAEMVAKALVSIGFQSEISGSTPNSSAPRLKGFSR